MTKIFYNSMSNDIIGKLMIKLIFFFCKFMNRTKIKNKIIQRVNNHKTKQLLIMKHLKLKIKDKKVKLILEII